MIHSSRSVRFISGCAWLIVAFLLVVAVYVGAKCNMANIADDSAESATEYAMKSAEEHLHNLEEAMGPPWPAHGPCDYESKFVKSTTYTINGRTVRYEFEIYITSTIMGCYVETSYYKVVVDYKGSVFSLVSVEAIDTEEEWEGTLSSNGLT